MVGNVVGMWLHGDCDWYVVGTCMNVCGWCVVGNVTWLVCGWYVVGNSL